MESPNEQTCPIAFARTLEIELNYYKRLYDTLDHSNEWQSKVIELAEEYILDVTYREEYLRKKWEIKP